MKGKQGAIFLRIQKFYIGYCIATWSLWGISILLAIVTGGAYHVQNISLYQFVLTISHIALISTVLPVHPILFVICLCTSIRHKRGGHTLFNICSILFSSLLAFLVFAYYAYMIGA